MGLSQTQIYHLGYIRSYRFCRIHFPSAACTVDIEKPNRTSSGRILGWLIQQKYCSPMKLVTIWMILMTKKVEIADLRD